MFTYKVFVIANYEDAYKATQNVEIALNGLRWLGRVTPGHRQHNRSIDCTAYDVLFDIETMKL